MSVRSEEDDFIGQYQGYMNTFRAKLEEACRGLKRDLQGAGVSVNLADAMSIHSFAAAIVSMDVFDTNGNAHIENGTTNAALMRYNEQLKLGIAATWCGPEENAPAFISRAFDPKFAGCFGAPTNGKPFGYTKFPGFSGGEYSTPNYPGDFGRMKNAYMESQDVNFPRRSFYALQGTVPNWQFGDDYQSWVNAMYAGCSYMQDAPHLNIDSIAKDFKITTFFGTIVDTMLSSHGGFTSIIQYENALDEFAKVKSWMPEKKAEFREMLRTRQVTPDDFLLVLEFLNITLLSMRLTATGSENNGLPRNYCAKVDYSIARPIIKPRFG